MNNKFEKNTPSKPKASKAIAIVRTPEQKFQLVEVAFNVEDPNVTVLLTDVREDVIDRFKMKAGELFMEIQS